VTAAKVIDASHQTLNARLDWQASGKLKLYLTLINLLDLQYEEVAGYATSKRAGYIGGTLDF
jgi:outer membrane cobalamin receptor